MKNTVGNIIKQKKMAMGLTQREVAESLSVTEQAVSRWERDIGLPDVSMLTSLASVLNININEILSGSISSGDNIGGNMKKISFIFAPFAAIF